MPLARLWLAYFHYLWTHIDFIAIFLGKLVKSLVTDIYSSSATPVEVPGSVATEDGG